MKLTILFVLAQLADALTYLALPAGSELNPLAASAGVAITLKLVVVSCIAGLPVFGKYRENVLLVGVVAGSVGFGSNLSVILA